MSMNTITITITITVMRSTPTELMFDPGRPAALVPGDHVGSSMGQGLFRGPRFHRRIVR